MEEDDEGGGRREPFKKRTVGSSDSEDSGSFESLNSPRHFEDASDVTLITSSEGAASFSNGNPLRERVVDLVERCERLERQKQAAVDLLADKKRQLEDAKERYDGKLRTADAETQRLIAENERLFQRLGLSEEERMSLDALQKELTEMRKRMMEAEARCSDGVDENLELRHELREARLEMEELHDQFREDEALEFRELQKELESTAKNCRILQFKFRKVEKRCEQMELDKRLWLERQRHHLQSVASDADNVDDNSSMVALAVGDSSDDSQSMMLRRHVAELEEELSVAKEVSVKFHDQLEMAEEKRLSYEHELDRVTALLNEAEAEKLMLRAELEHAREQQSVGAHRQNSLPLPQPSSEKHHSPTSSKTPSPSVDFQLIMRDLNDSLEREHDLREQLKFSEEEIIVMRKKMAEMEEELESVNHQLARLATAKQATAPKSGPVAEAAEREQELKLQIELAESESKVLRRRLDEMDSSYEVLLSEVKQMRSRVTSFAVFDSSTDTVSSGLPMARSTTSWDSNYEETVRNLAKDIDKLKIKLIERDQHADRTRRRAMDSQNQAQETQPSCFMVKSRSLEDENIDCGFPASISVSGRIGRLKKMARVREEEEETRVYLDARIQAEILEQEALLLRSKVKTLEQEVVSLKNENDSLKRESYFDSNNRPQSLEPSAGMSRVEVQQQENASMRNTIHELEDKLSKFNKELLRMKFRTVDPSKDRPEEWNEIKKQVLLLEDENRKCQRKIVDVEAEGMRLKARLETWEPVSSEISSRKEELEKNSKDFLKKRVVELEGDLKSIYKVIAQREEESERLENEISEGREDLTRLMDAFKRREDLLAEEMEDMKKKNVMVSDLLQLVTERAESTQKELDRLREKETPASSTQSTKVAPVPSNSSKKDEQSDLAVLRNQVQILQRLLNEEKKKSEAAALRLKMADQPAGTSQNEKSLKQQEKDITQQELALCQKQLKAANDQISSLKERLATTKESHDDLKSGLTRVTKELEKVREEKESAIKTSLTTSGQNTTVDTPASTQSVAATPATTMTSTAAGARGSEVTAPTAPPRTKEPASWRWEKQEMERQLKELRKKLDDSYMEMKRYQVRWKAAGEDIERESQIKVELEKKIGKLEEEKNNLRVKLEELNESTMKVAKQWERELNMSIKDREDAEKEVKQLAELIVSKDDIIQQKNKLIAEKEKSKLDKDKALRESTEATIVAEVSLRNMQSELSTAREQLKTLELELTNLKPQVMEKDQQVKQLDEQLRRRDDRLKEKDDFLQQINRKLAEKGNQVSDMDKTIRQIIRKLQARDCDLGMTNAELRRVQNDLRSTQEKYQDAKAALDAWETKAKMGNFKTSQANSAVVLRNGSDNRVLDNSLRSLTEDNSRLQSCLVEKDNLVARLKQVADKNTFELEMKVKLAEEKAHAADLLLTAANTKLQSQNGSDNSGTSFTPSDAYKQMMREKETLISEKFKLTEELSGSKRQLESLKIELDKLKSEQSERTKASASSSVYSAVGMTGSPGSVKKHQRPESLSLSLAQTIMTNTASKTAVSLSTVSNKSTSNISSYPAEATQVIASLQAKLGQQELHWRAEKATLEEYYDVQAQQLREAGKQLQISNQLLRKECDSQLLIVQNSRRALADLRHRFDLATVAWSEERDALKSKADQVDDLREQIKALDKNLSETSSKLSSSEAKRSEFENKLSIETAIWKVEKEAVEKIKTVQTALPAQNATESANSASSTANATKSTPFTRVSEFKARFEKFSRVGKKFDDQTEKAVKRSSDSSAGSSGSNTRLLEDLVRNLQTQITQLDGRRASDENAWRKRLNDLNHNYENDLADLRKKLTAFEKKDKEYTRQQRILSELQFRFVDDACQWQKQRAQLEQQIDASRKELMQHKESVSRLVAEVKRLKVLASGVAAATSSIQSGADTKTRSRSLTPGAEKIRIMALSAKEKANDLTTLNPSEVEGPLKTPCDDLIIQDLVQAVEKASKLAEEINHPGPIFASQNFGVFSSSTIAFGRRKSLGLSGSFKRSSSTAEVTSSTSEAASSVIDVAYRPSKRELRKSSSQEGGANMDAGVVVAVSPSDSKSNRNSMYTSGTQSAYASRDHSPDSNLLPILTLPRGPRTIRSSSQGIVSSSPYPKAPPSMIITPSHTPNRAESVERGPTGISEADVNVVYRKLEALMVSEGADKSFNRRVAVVSGVDDHYRRQSGDRQLFGLSGSSSSDISFVPPADLITSATHRSQPTAAVDERFSFASRTLPVSRSKQVVSPTPIKFVSATMPHASLSSNETVGVEGRTGRESRQTSGMKQRSASVSPKTARRQFYENYDKLTKFQSSSQHRPPQQVQKKYLFSDYAAEHRHPGDVFGIESGFTPISKSTVTTASASDIHSKTKPSVADTAKSPTSSSSSVGKKILKLFSSKDALSSEQDVAATGKSGPGGFFQSVKERRKLFGGKKASSVDSPIGVSIARIGVNILTEPAAPSNYQPPELPSLNFPSAPLQPSPLLLASATPSLTTPPATSPSTASPILKPIATDWSGTTKGEKRK